jgi:exopolyphosphatase/pppGpp-phosphohydrolase
VTSHGGRLEPAVETAAVVDLGSNSWRLVAYVILNAGLAGSRQLALIAQIVRYQRKGSPGRDGVSALARSGDAKLVGRCALLLRLARQLDRGDGPAIHLPVDAQLARWSIARQFADGEFRRVFGRRLMLVD